MSAIVQRTRGHAVTGVVYADNTVPVGEMPRLVVRYGIWAVLSWGVVATVVAVALALLT